MSDAPRTLTVSLLLAALTISCAKSVDLSSADRSEPPAKFRATGDPTAVAEINERVSDIVVDEQRIYWAGSDGTAYPFLWLRSCAKQDCANTVVDYASTEYWLPFGVENGQVYWIDLDTCCSVVSSCGVGGCTGAPREVGRTSPNEGAASQVAFTSDAVYLCGESFLEKIPLSGAGPRLTLAAPSTCSAVAARDDFVYWIAQSDTNPSLLALRRTAVDGSSSPTLLADSLRIPSDAFARGISNRRVRTIALTANFAYWGQGSLYGSIARCSLMGCPAGPEVIAEPLRSPFGVLVDGSTLYFQYDTSEQAGAIASLLLPSGAPSEPLADNVQSQSALAIDDRYVYTATSDEPPPVNDDWVDPWASIRRIPKPVGAPQ